MQRTGMGRGAAGAGVDLAALAGLGLSVNAAGTGLDNDFITGVPGGQTAVGGTGVNDRLLLRGSSTGTGFVDSIQPFSVVTPNTSIYEPQLTIWAKDAGADNGHATLLLKVNIGANLKFSGLTGDAAGNLDVYGDGALMNFWIRGQQIQRWLRVDDSGSPSYAQIPTSAGGAGFYFDRTNTRLGLGTAAPDSPLHMTGTGVQVHGEAASITWLARSTGSTAFARLQLESQSGSANNLNVTCYATAAAGALWGFNVADRIYYEHNSADVFFGTGTNHPVYFFTNAALRMSIEGNGDVVMGVGALATNATGGFFFAPSGAGAPTGTPVARAGRVPIYFNTTGTGALYAYIGGAWRTIALT